MSISSSAEEQPPSDDWLKEIEESAGNKLSAILKRGITNISIRKLQTNQEYDQIVFDDIYFQENNTDVTIKGLASTKEINCRIRQIESDMQHSVFTVQIDLNNIELKGNYEILNRDQVGLLPVTNIGNISILLENVTASGFIGFKRNANDSFETTNFNLDYIPTAIEVEVLYLGMGKEEIIKSRVRHTDIEDTILKLFKAELWWKIQSDIIKKNMDNVLSDLSVMELFQNQKDALIRYSMRGDFTNRLANTIVDKFLTKANVLIKEKGYSTIKISNYERSFSHSFGPLTFWGGFSATDGFASNLSTIYRTGNFSIVPIGPNLITTFGALGLRQFGFNYNKYKAQIWNIGPGGEIKSIARSNSVAFKITSTGLNPSRQIEIKDFDFYIERLDDVDVNVTGMGYPMNWLLSRVATWMFGFFKTNIRTEVEAVLQKQLNSVIGYKLSNVDI